MSNTLHQVFVGIAGIARKNNMRWIVVSRLTRMRHGQSARQRGKKIMVFLRLDAGEDVKD